MKESRRHRVLILEDEADIVELIREALQPLDLDIAAASTAEGMTKLISTNFFDAIILDNRMPTMTGIELVEQIRKKRVVTPVVFVSGGLTALDQDEMEKLGAVEFFAKPFLPSALRESVLRSVKMGEKLSTLETALSELQEMGALSPTATDSFKHLLLDLVRNPQSNLDKKI